VASQAQPQLIPKSIVHTCSVCQTDIDVPLTNGRLPLSTKCPKCGTEYTFQQTQPPPKSLLDYAPEQWKVLVDAIGDQFRRYQEVSSHGQRRIAYPIFFLITVIFASTAFLAYSKIITGEAFLILGGTIVGYLLSFLGDYVAPRED
jgi:hypothetical protein